MNNKIEVNNKVKITKSEVKKHLMKIINNIIQKSIEPKKIEEIMQKHNNKLHFISIEERIYAGIIQSLNIQFGNILEDFLSNLVAKNIEEFEIEQISSSKKEKWEVKESINEIVDNYINKRKNKYQNSKNKKDKLEPIDVDSDFEFFRKQLENALKSNSKTIKISNDIDLLFKNKLNNCYYYVEIKYNDDHDTGKFENINRKFLKTYAYLFSRLNLTDIDKIKPILLYFNNKKKINWYLPKKYIMDGSEFVNNFTQVDFEWIKEGIEESKALSLKTLEILKKKISERLFPKK